MGYRGRHRAPAPRIAVNAARIAVGGLVLAEITGGFPAVPAYASTPVVLASSHHSTDGADKHLAHRSKHHRHHPAQHVKAPVRPAVTHQAVTAAVYEVAPATPESQPAPAATLDQQQLLFDHYIVMPGDTLTHIAAAYQVPWESLWAFNTDAIPHPDAIYPGLRLRLPA
jgi:LysM repeat protein